MSNKNLTLIRISNTEFEKVYKKFVLNSSNDLDYKTILSLAIIFINSENIFVKKLGYNMIIVYGNQTKDYLPLYEISINMGLFPISKFIYNSIYKDQSNESFFLELNDSFINIYKKDNLFQSFEQKKLLDFFNENMNNCLSIVAPTSYGKTDLIISLIEQVKDKNICILTPTKSLLAQTKKRILNSKINGIKKIITNPEMYDGTENNIIAILTQERLLRLLIKDSSIKFDYIVIDEAHNLLKNDSRNVLLASVLIICEKRNSKIVLKFLTPFLNDQKNLNLKFSRKKKEEFTVNEFIKSERYFIYDSVNDIGNFQLYDQYMNSFYQIDSNLTFNDIEFVENKKKEKNIIYLNKPIDIENFTHRLSIIRNNVNSIKIDKACKNLAEFIHPKYKLIKYLKKGIIYHHGSVPDSIRLYIEKLYHEIPEINCVITNSTLLEGVNLPADCMFLLDNKKGLGNLSPSSFKNLIGRICRFSDIFKENSSLNKLSPHIYLVRSEYYSKNADLQKFLIKSAKIDNKIVDNPKNILLEKTEISKNNRHNYIEALEFVENCEKDSVNQKNNIRYATTEIGKSCFLNNIKEIPIFEVEIKLQTYIDFLRTKNYKITNSNHIFTLITKLFVSYISTDSTNYQNLIRLNEIPAQKFYTMFLNWKIAGISYAEMINSFLKYWDMLIEKGLDTTVYVGRWGDVKREGYRKLWTNIHRKSNEQRINLAIVRIKEEQDFLNNEIMRYIEVLNDLQLIDEGLYLKIKYGTDNLKIITLVRNGIGLSLAKLILAKYKHYVEIDIKNNIVSINENIIEKMQSNDENDVLINEISYFI